MTDLGKLSDVELEVYSRQIALKDIGYNGQLKLKAGKVCVVGLGGLGSSIALKLVAMGVGYIRLIDRDVVSRSDLHRQYLYDTDSIGYPKVEVAARKLKKLNPDINLEVLPVSINSSNVEESVGGVDVVADGLDRPEPRYLLNKACISLHIPYVFGGAIETYGNLSTIIPGKTACLECFMPELRNEDMPKCGVVGVHPSVLGIVTSIQVSEAIRLLIGEDPKLLNKLLYVDLQELRFDLINVVRSEECPACNPEATHQYRHIDDKYFEETCARDGGRTFVITPKGVVKLNLTDIRNRLKDRKIHISRVSDLGITFELYQGLSASILESGVMIAYSSHKLKLDPKKEIIEVYTSLLGDELGAKGLLPF